MSSSHKLPSKRVRYNKGLRRVGRRALRRVNMVDSCASNTSVGQMAHTRVPLCNHAPTPVSPASRKEAWGFPPSVQVSAVGLCGYLCEYADGNSVTCLT